MKSIFISYSYNDSYAKTLVDAIKKMSTDNIILLNDSKDFVGTNFEIFDPINKCDFFVSMINRSNSNLMLELGYALGQNKNIILIGEHGEIPYELRNYEYINKSEDLSKVILELHKRLDKNVIEEKRKEEDKEIKNNEIISIKNKEIINTMNYREFENFVFTYLIDKNPSISIYKAQKDKQYDFSIPSLDCFIDIKKYNNNSKVSLSTIRSFLGLMTENNVKKGIILSSAEFTLSAINFVKNIKNLDYKIILLTLSNLLEIDGNLMSILK
ncbi:MAG: restriction endonuclease [Ruminococcus sp.]|nr:restriction endonuclease [Ruminococcus sp.]